MFMWGVEDNGFGKGENSLHNWIFEIPEGMDFSENNVCYQQKNFRAKCSFPPGHIIRVIFWMDI